MELPDLSGQVRKGIEGLLAVANLCSGQIVVVGCSTSEIAGQKIGSASNMEIAWEVFSGLIGPPLKSRISIWLFNAVNT